MKTSRIREIGRGGLLALWLSCLPAAAQAAFDVVSTDTVQFSQASYQAQEGTILNVTLTRTGQGVGSVTAEVLIGSTGDTAVLENDYYALGEILTWADGDMGDKTVSIEIFSDGLVEGDEFFTLQLVPRDQVAAFASKQAVGTPDTATVTIVDVMPQGDGRIETVSGDLQQGGPGDVLQPFVVSVSDAQGNPLSGVTVSWSVEPATGGQLAQPTSTTNSNGTASNTLTLNSSDPVVVKAVVLLAIGNELPLEASFRVNATGTQTTNSLTGNQRAVARSLETACQALEALGDGVSQPQAELLATCQGARGLDPQAQAELLDALAPEEVAAQGQLILDTARFQTAGVFRRLASLRAGARGLDLSGLRVSLAGQRLPPEVLEALLGASGGSAGGELADIATRWGLFVNADLLLGDRERSAAEAGYDMQGTGLTLGADYRLSNALVLGAALGYGRNASEFENAGGRSELDGYNLSAYGSYFGESNFFLDGLLRAGRNAIDTRRRTGPAPGSPEARGRTRGWEYAASLSGGYEYAREALTASPYGRVSYIRADIDGYAETATTGSGSVLAIERQELDSLTAVLGGRFSYAISASNAVYLLQLSGEWEHEFRDDPRAISARFFYDPARTRFNVFTDSPDTDYFNLGLGLSAVFAHGRSAYFYYESRLGQAYVRLNWFNLGFRWEL